jgi:hypothetical protein
VLFAIILVAEFMSGFAAGAAAKAYRNGGSPVYVFLALLGAAEVFALAWACTQIV